MAVFWLTGMPCSGKTTIGHALVQRLGELGRVACLIDGDVVRRGGLSRGLGFSTADRRENVRRVAGLAARLAREIDVVVAMVSPTEQIREPARALPGLVMVGLHCPPDVARLRDFKGVYRRAWEAASYEPPDSRFRHHRHQPHRRSAVRGTDPGLNGLTGARRPQPVPPRSINTAGGLRRRVPNRSLAGSVECLRGPVELNQYVETARDSLRRHVARHTAAAGLHFIGLAHGALCRCSMSLRSWGRPATRFIAISPSADTTVSGTSSSS